MNTINYSAIKPIETEYDGILYRSRLEAQWAYTFNKFGISFIYEPFCLNKWLPDFQIRVITPDGIRKILVEVKPFNFEICEGNIENFDDAIDVYLKAYDQIENAGTIWLLGNGFMRDNDQKYKKISYWGVSIQKEDKYPEPEAVCWYANVPTEDLWKESINQTRYEPSKKISENIRARDNCRKQLISHKKRVPQTKAEELAEEVDLQKALKLLKESYIIKINNQRLKQTEEI